MEILTVITLKQLSVGFPHMECLISVFYMESVRVGSRIDGNVSISSSRQALITRMAISPRLAIRSFQNISLHSQQYIPVPDPIARIYKHPVDVPINRAVDRILHFHRFENRQGISAFFSLPPELSGCKCQFTIHTVLSDNPHHIMVRMECRRMIFDFSHLRSGSFFYSFPKVIPFA
jgi:hypothetical protein